ncbi:SPOR domain-containing protein [Cohnella sp. 56]|uniref:SPOR domain-containing protein n=1 Tax=Cohnella sp. 56 TaxID=3113722 RepID=UPI0030E81FD6
MQPPARMTFKFDGNLPREVRSTDNAPHLENQSSGTATDGRGAATVSADKHTVFRPRGFSQKPDRAAVGAVAGGYRLPGKSAHLAGERPVPAPAGKRDGYANSHAGAPDARNSWQSPYQDDVEALEDMIRGTDGTGTGRVQPDKTIRADRKARGTAYDPETGAEVQRAGRPAASRAARQTAPADAPPAPERIAAPAAPQMAAPAPLLTAAPRNRAPRTAAPAERVAGFRKSTGGYPPAAPAPRDRRELPEYGAGRDAAPFSDAYPSEDVYDDYGEYGHYGRDDDMGNRARPGAEAADDDSFGHGYETRRRGGPSWLRIFLSVAGAIVTGALFGYIVLALFTGEPLLPVGGGDDPTSSAAVQAGGSIAPSPAASPAGAGGAPSTAGAAKATATAATKEGAAKEPQGGTTDTVRDAKVPSSVSYLLQYGVFQNGDSMNEAVKELAAQGIAAATDTSDGFRVYAGIAATKADAEQLAAVLTDSELYVKALDNRALDLPQTAAAVSWAAYLEASDGLGRLLGGESAKLLAQGGRKPLGEQAAADIKSAQRQWEQSTAGMDGWSGSRRDAAATLAAELKSSAEQISGYKSEPSPAKLRAAQTSAMKAALIARTLREELGEDGD